MKPQPIKTGNWYTDRFIYSESKTHKNCIYCNRDFYLPKSKSKNRVTCGKECNSKLHAKNKLARLSICKQCGCQFTPRKYQVDHGVGKYCSSECALKNTKHLLTSESLDGARKSRRNNFLIGKWTPPKGEKHYAWKGGSDARKLRLKISGAARLANKKYRKNNPIKAREFKINRSGKKFGRLPNGFIEKIYLLQKECCAICCKKLNGLFHVDHIYPLSKGGLHVKENIQILCQRCNLTKSAKDPIAFMQERGFLI